jgi:RNA polymerase sigma factor (sigma-70 family)
VRTYWRWPLVRRHEHPWAYARKVLVNLHRALGRRALVEARHRAAEPPPAAVLSGLEEGVMAHVTVRAALLGLPPRQRAVVVLRYYEDLSEAEVARLLWMPVGTVKSTASRAMAKLRHLLADAEPGTGARKVTR